MTTATLSAESSRQATNGSQKFLAGLFWAYVSIPLAWGIVQTIKKAMALFN